MIEIELTENEITNFRNYLGENLVNLNIFYDKFYEFYYIQILNEDDTALKHAKLVNGINIFYNVSPTLKATQDNKILKIEEIKNELNQI